MKDDKKYALGPDVAHDEVLIDSAGRAVDDDYVAAAVEDAMREARRRGRPSLSTSGESPLLRVRLSRRLDADIRKAAEGAGKSRSDWVRGVLTEAASGTH